MSLRRLLEGQQLPLAPDVSSKASMEKWIRDINDYLRRLSGLFSAINIINTIVEEGGGDAIDEKVALTDGLTPNYLENLLNDLQTSTRDATKDFDLDIERVGGKLTRFIDISTISGYTAGNEQVLTHSASGGLAWVDTDTC